jgi:general secretion pathway protein H
VRPGFTLVEVLAVILIMGLTAAVATPAFRDTSAHRPVDRLAHDVMSVLIAARTTALESGRPVRVTLDSATASYRIEPVGTEASATSTGTLVTTTGWAARIRPSATRFVFEPDGIATGGQVLVEGQDGRRAVIIDRWTGDVRTVRR